MKKKLLAIAVTILSLLATVNAQQMNVSPSSIPNIEEGVTLPNGGNVPFTDIPTITGSVDITVSGTKTGSATVYGGLNNGLTIKADKTNTGADRNNLSSDETLSYSFTNLSVTPVSPGYTPILAISQIKVREFSTGESFELRKNGNLVETIVDASGSNAQQSISLTTPLTIANNDVITLILIGTSTLRSTGFTIIDANASTLPIALQSFDAKNSNEGITLKWTTSSEKNNSYFEILRSEDGKKFNAIGKVNGANNSDQTINYSFIDKNPLPGTNYYQLKQVDFDGAFTLSNFTSASFSLNNNNLKIAGVQNNNLNFFLSANYNSKAEVYLSDLSGKKISQSTIFIQTGENSFDINMLGAVKGIYILTLKTNKDILRQKFVF